MSRDLVKKLKMDEYIWVAANQVATQRGETLDAFIEECVKKRLTNVGVTWWQSLIEVATHQVKKNVVDGGSLGSNQK